MLNSVMSHFFYMAIWSTMRKSKWTEKLFKYELFKSQRTMPFLTYYPINSLRLCWVALNHEGFFFSFFWVIATSAFMIWQFKYQTQDHFPLMHAHQSNKWFWNIMNYFLLLFNRAVQWIQQLDFHHCKHKSGGWWESELFQVLV